MPRRRPDFEPGEAVVEAAQLNKLSDADGLKSGGCPTLAEPILESRAVSPLLTHWIGGLAQLVEHLICIQRVRSSSLLASI